MKKTNTVLKENSRYHCQLYGNSSLVMVAFKHFSVCHPLLLLIVHINTQAESSTLLGLVWDNMLLPRMCARESNKMHMFIVWSHWPHLLFYILLPVFRMMGWAQKNL
ncbi:hypothetical protein XENTR_v10008655 [Xenopus tropicalis]|nr:hypothetical protein XENTR_v10008655 [Xenopus tropicalis]